MPQIDIIEEGEDGGFDISADVIEVAEKPGPAAPDDEFISSARFSGRRPGYAFTTGDRGTGYYRDPGRRRPGVTVAARKAAPKVAPPPASAVALELLHRGNGAGARGATAVPHSVEMRLDLKGGPNDDGEAAAAYAGVKAAAFKVAVVVADPKAGGAGCSLRVTSPGCWVADARLEVPVGYPLAVERAQGWLHNGTLTLRLPIAA